MTRKADGDGKLDLRTLVYGSFASLDFTRSDLERLHDQAAERNRENEITGVLLFNGTHFLQLIEGRPDAIEELMDRIRRDSRHVGVEVEHDDSADKRYFPDWALGLVHVRGLPSAELTADGLPDGLPEKVRSRFQRMLSDGGPDVDLPD